MWNWDSHLSDQQLLLELDGESSSRRGKELRAHLAQCWKCRVRRTELEMTITHFVRRYQRELDAELLPPDGPRAMLKARLSYISDADSFQRPNWNGFWWVPVAVVCGFLLTGVSFVTDLRRTHQMPVHRQAAVISMPDSRLTPGATIFVDRQTVCAHTSSNNKPVPAVVQRQVFAAYGIDGAQPEGYEIDYLITPALAGADDIHNLWPQSHSSTAWNAEVKDALEDRLHQLVCNGDLDLAKAQEEIAANWVAAYKEYFHTDRPLPEHAARTPAGQRQR
jgi:hypothetical protein